MIYDSKFFDQVFERRGHDAKKWDEPLFVKDNKDIVPMWVADMDFMTPRLHRQRHVRETEASRFRLLLHPEGLL